ncbi:MAG: hypothetical protein EPN88_09660 [Bacteroidetes bacterium]|nr:MAG: hypothetical protein EPN88_09660 [Bacteroidota bacterium]
MINPELESVYLQTDRSYWLSGESILFKAYILYDFSKSYQTINDTLFLVLLDQDGTEVASGTFPFENNQVAGNIELPDFLTEGNYILIATTYLRINQPPEKMISRIIEIRKSVDSDLFTNLSLTDSLYTSGSQLTANIKFSTKDNKPSPVNFTYQLTGRFNEILSGKSKAKKDGSATLTLKLPEFEDKEILKLIVIPSSNGWINSTGIVIPTKYNYAGGKKDTAGNISVDKFKHLKILIRTNKQHYEQKEKVDLDIYVTDEKGTPMRANLSVSASNVRPHQLLFENDSIGTYTNLKSKQSTPNSSCCQEVSETNKTTMVLENDKHAYDIGMGSIFSATTRKFFAQCLLNLTQSPGSQFIVQEKNNLKKLLKRKESVNKVIQTGYSSDRKVMDILMQIKPYRLQDGMIFFGMRTALSINSQEGALIIIDGIKMGTNPEILNNIPVVDIAKITASTNPIDIQRYSAMNSTGIIEVTMKKWDDSIKAKKPAIDINSSTIFWGPDITTDASGKASISFFNNNKSFDVLISVDGLTTNGLVGTNSIQYSVNPKR